MGDSGFAENSDSLFNDLLPVAHDMARRLNDLFKSGNGNEFFQEYQFTSIAEACRGCPNDYTASVCKYLHEHFGYHPSAAAYSACNLFKEMTINPVRALLFPNSYGNNTIIGDVCNIYRDSFTTLPPLTTSSPVPAYNTSTVTSALTTTASLAASTVTSALTTTASLASSTVTSALTTVSSAASSVFTATQQLTSSFGSTLTSMWWSSEEIGSTMESSEVGSTMESSEGSTTENTAYSVMRTLGISTPVETMKSAASLISTAASSTPTYSPTSGVVRLDCEPNASDGSISPLTIGLIVTGVFVAGITLGPVLQYGYYKLKNYIKGESIQEGERLLDWESEEHKQSFERVVKLIRGETMSDKSKRKIFWITNNSDDNSDDKYDDTLFTIIVSCVQQSLLQRIKRGEIGLCNNEMLQRESSKLLRNMIKAGNLIKDIDTVKQDNSLSIIEQGRVPAEGSGLESIQPLVFDYQSPLKGKGEGSLGVTGKANSACSSGSFISNDSLEVVVETESKLTPLLISSQGVSGVMGKIDDDVSDSDDVPDSNYVPVSDESESTEGVNKDDEVHKYADVSDSDDVRKYDDVASSSSDGSESTQEDNPYEVVETQPQPISATTMTVVSETPALLTSGKNPSSKTHSKKPNNKRRRSRRGG